MRRLVLIAALVLVVGGGGYWFYAGHGSAGGPQAAGQGAKGKGQRARPVKVERVHTAPVADEIEAIGTLSANESVTLTAKTQGIIRFLNFQDSQIVKKGEELAAIDAGAEDAALRVEAANLYQQQRELERTMTLAKEQHVSQSKVDELQATVKKAEANVAAATVRAGDRHIVAPFSGIVGIRRISLGALVSPGTAIATLDDISTMKLDLSVPETFLSSLKPGLSVEARASAFPGEVFKGIVASIDTRVDAVTRTVTVRATLANGELKLRPGMLMVADLIKDPRNSVVVPEVALQPENDKQFVYVVTPNGTATKTLVTLGSRRQGIVEVVNGLQDGDTVIVEGMQDLPSGAKVAIVNADAPADGKGQQGPTGQDRPS